MGYRSRCSCNTDVIYLANAEQIYLQMSFCVCVFTVMPSCPLSPYYNVRRQGSCLRGPSPQLPGGDGHPTCPPLLEQVPWEGIRPFGAAACQHAEVSRAKSNPAARRQVENRSWSPETFPVTHPAEGLPIPGAPVDGGARKKCRCCKNAAIL